MTLDDALRDLAATGSALPREAMRWSLAHWDEAGPHLVALLDAYASGQDRSEATGRALFFAIHLLGEKAEGAAFGPLCRLLLDAEASDLILGDAITSTLRGILIGTYDDDLAALQAVIEAEDADEFVREVALLALAYLARTGRVPEAEMRAYLVHLLTAMRPQAEHFVWVGWLLAVAHLGYEDLAGDAEGLIRRGFVSERDWRVADFRADLRRTLADPKRMAGFEHDRIGPFTDAIEALEGWHAFSGEDDAEPALPDLAGSDDYEVQRPIINPLRGVGRNDPCPCGSGRKYKKCCLAAA
jgi:uncharacterized protein